MRSCGRTAPVAGVSLASDQPAARGGSRQRVLVSTPTVRGNARLPGTPAAAAGAEGAAERTTTNVRRHV
jgi:hypothetical protein